MDSDDDFEEFLNTRNKPSPVALGEKSNSASELLGGFDEFYSSVENGNPTATTAAAISDSDFGSMLAVSNSNTNNKETSATKLTQATHDTHASDVVDFGDFSSAPTKIEENLSQTDFGDFSSAPTPIQSEPNGHQQSVGDFSTKTDNQLDDSFGDFSSAPTKVEEIANERSEPAQLDADFGDFSSSPTNLKEEMIIPSATVTENSSKKETVDSDLREVSEDNPQLFIKQPDEQTANATAEVHFGDFSSSPSSEVIPPSSEVMEESKVSIVQPTVDTFTTSLKITPGDTVGEKNAQSAENDFGDFPLPNDTTEGTQISATATSPTTAISATPSTTTPPTTAAATTTTTTTNVNDQEVFDFNEFTPMKTFDSSCGEVMTEASSSGGATKNPPESIISGQDAVSSLSRGGSGFFGNFAASPVIAEAASSGIGPQDYTPQDCSVFSAAFSEAEVDDSVNESGRDDRERLASVSPMSVSEASLITTSYPTSGNPVIASVAKMASKDDDDVYSQSLASEPSISLSFAENPTRKQLSVPPPLPEVANCSETVPLPSVIVTSQAAFVPVAHPTADRSRDEPSTDNNRKESIPSPCDDFDDICPSPIPVKVANGRVGEDDFGDFSSAPAPLSVSDNGDVVFESTATQQGVDRDDDFGDFSSAAVPIDAEQSNDFDLPPVGKEDINQGINYKQSDDFSEFSSPVVVNSTATDDNNITNGDFPSAPVVTSEVTTELNDTNDVGNFPSAPAASVSKSDEGFGDFSAAPAEVKKDDFGDFSAAPAEVKKDDFGDFSAAPAEVKKDDFGDFSAAPAEVKKDDFGDCSAAPAEVKKDDFGDFSAAPAEVKKDDFGDFSAAPAEVKNDDFGDFSAAPAEVKKDDFGDFSAAPAEVKKDDFGDFSAAPVEVKKDDFGDFSAAPAEVKKDDFGDFSAAPVEVKKDDFGDFSAAPAEVKKDDFGDFSAAPAEVKKDDFGDCSAAPAEVKKDDFGDFSAAPAEVKKDDFGDFSAAPAEVKNDDFGDFSAAPAEVKKDDFGDFSAAPAEVKKDDFGDFSAAPVEVKKDDFGDFSAAPAEVKKDDFGDFSAAPVEVKKDDFGDFSAAPAEVKKDDFGDFSAAPAEVKKDDFGDFSAAPAEVKKDDFGDFSAAPAEVKKDDFGDFSTPAVMNETNKSDANDFGDFSAAPDSAVGVTTDTTQENDFGNFSSAAATTDVKKTGLSTQSAGHQLSASPHSLYDVINNQTGRDLFKTLKNMISSEQTVTNTPSPSSFQSLVPNYSSITTTEVSILDDFRSSQLGMQRAEGNNFFAARNDLPDDEVDVKTEMPFEELPSVSQNVKDSAASLDALEDFFGGPIQQSNVKPLPPPPKVSNTPGIGSDLDFLFGDAPRPVSSLPKQISPGRVTDSGFSSPATVKVPVKTPIRSKMPATETPIKPKATGTSKTTTQNLPTYGGIHHTAHITSLVTSFGAGTVASLPALPLKQFVAF